MFVRDLWCKFISPSNYANLLFVSFFGTPVKAVKPKVYRNRNVHKWRRNGWATEGIDAPTFMEARFCGTYSEGEAYRAQI